MQKTSLSAQAREQLALARVASSGRSATTVYGGTRAHPASDPDRDGPLGVDSMSHANPGEATVYVLSGRVSLAAADNALERLTRRLADRPPTRSTAWRRSRTPWSC